MNYEAIQEHIARARIEQSAFVGELVADVVLASWSAVKRAAGLLRTLIEGTSDYLPRSQA